MNDEQLSKLLSQLGHLSAADDFVGRTLQRLGERPRGGRTWRRFAAVAVGCLVLLGAAVPLGIYLRGWLQEEHVRRELQALRGEHRRLQTELASLRQQARQQPQILYLGGTDSVDYVVDLRQLALRPGKNRRGSAGARPVRF